MCHLCATYSFVETYYFNCLSGQLQKIDRSFFLKISLEVYKVDIQLKKLPTLLTLCTILISLFLSPAKAFAADMTNIKAGDWSSTWHLKAFNGLHWTDNGIYMKQVDNEIAFCVGHGIDLDMSGSGYNPSEYQSSLKDRLALIAYYGYQQNPTNHNYGVTQMLIWETLGDELLTGGISDYQEQKKAILAKVNAFGEKPSFADQTITLNVGDSITLTDTKNRLSQFTEQTANSAGLQVEKSGNTLKLTATKDSKESGSLAYALAKQANVGQSFVYTKGDQQKLVNFKLANAGEFKLNIKVNLKGNVRAKKVDADTGKALPNAKLKFEYDGKTKEVITGADGSAALDDIKAGTKVKISEVQAPNGYYNKGNLKEVTVAPNQTIEVVLGNKKQLGNVQLAKIGKEYGTNMFNKYYSLNGAVYGIYSADGKKVGTIKTDSTGKGQLSNLPLGKYYALEEEVPAGYVLSDEKINFELAYAGQNVQVATSSIKGTDQEQFGTANLVKQDKETGDKAQGKASLEGAVYELHRVSDNKLVKAVTIKDGKASVNNLPLDDYYWVETKAPKGYLLDTEKHTFKLEYAGQDKKTTTDTETVKEQVIKGEFDLVKVAGDQSEVARLVNVDEAAKSKHALKDIEFTVTSDTTKKVIKTGKTDEKGYLHFTDLPYDTYTVTETKAPDGYTAVKPFKVTIKEQGQFFHYKVENKQPETPETPNTPNTPNTPETPKASKLVSTIASKLPQTGEKSTLWLSIIGGILLFDVLFVIGMYRFNKNRH